MGNSWDVKYGNSNFHYVCGHMTQYTLPEDRFETVVEIIGWVGSISILLAYALNSYQKIRSDSPVFLFLNLIGGLLLMAYGYYKDAFANTFLNFVWVVVALIALGKLYRKRIKKKPRS